MHHRYCKISDLKTMANERGALDLDTPPPTPTTNSTIGSAKHHHGGPSQGCEEVKYTLKPATRAYASTARYVPIVRKKERHCLSKHQDQYRMLSFCGIGSICNTISGRIRLAIYSTPVYLFREWRIPKLQIWGQAPGTHIVLCVKLDAIMIVDRIMHALYLACISDCRSKQRTLLVFSQIHRSNPSHPHRIWLLDLARTLPSTAQLDGFDIDISDCPHEQWLPRNVKMQQFDALSEIPEHLVGMYDIVQLRLFQVVVRDNDPGPLLRNVLRMLSGCSNLLIHKYVLRFIYVPSIFLTRTIFHLIRHKTTSLAKSISIHLRNASSNANVHLTEPGGYLQWAEYDMTSQTTIKATPTLSSSALEAIPAFVQGFKKKDGRVGKQKYVP